VSPTSIEVSYEDIGPSGYIDQTVTLDYSGKGWTAPTIEYTPLDSSGEKVEGVDVTTAFGSDRGLLAFGAPGGFDILAFHGNRVAEVVGVNSVVVDSTELDGPSAVWPEEPTPLLANEVVTKFDLFDAVKVENSGDTQIAVRVVCLLYNVPAPGEAQQAEEIAVVVDRVEVAAASSAVAAVPEWFVAQATDRGFGCDSLKSHLTP